MNLSFRPSVKIENMIRYNLEFKYNSFSGVNLLEKYGFFTTCLILFVKSNTYCFGTIFSVRISKKSNCSRESLSGLSSADRYLKGQGLHPLQNNYRQTIWKWITLFTSSSWVNINTRVLWQNSFLRILSLFSIGQPAFRYCNIILQIL